MHQIHKTSAMTHLLRKKAAAVTIALFFMASSASSQPANGNYCGSSWMDAVSRCAKSCPSGAPTECIGGETCFAGTPVSLCFFSKYTYERYSAHVIHQLYVSYLFLSVSRVSARNPSSGSTIASTGRNMRRWTGR